MPDAQIVLAINTHLGVVDEHTEYVSGMENAAVVVRCKVGTDGVGLGAKVDGDVEIDLPFDTLNASGEFGPWQTARWPAVE